MNQLVCCLHCRKRILFECNCNRYQDMVLPSHLFPTLYPMTAADNLARWTLLCGMVSCGHGDWVVKEYSKVFVPLLAKHGTQLASAAYKLVAELTEPFLDSFVQRIEYTSADTKEAIDSFKNATKTSDKVSAQAWLTVTVVDFIECRFSMLSGLQLDAIAAMIITAEGIADLPKLAMLDLLGHIGEVLKDLFTSKFYSLEKH